VKLARLLTLMIALVAIASLVAGIKWGTFGFHEA
jgi:hypothetical protein